ncbi:MAG: DUF3489 domain-containing protein [Anderseniella sp.]|nr:DUF3489 domain-containing protein [Anderseniella sp.]
MPWSYEQCPGTICLAPERADSARLRRRTEHCWVCLVIGRLAQSVLRPRLACIRGLRSVQAPGCPVAPTEEIIMARKTPPCQQPSQHTESPSTTPPDKACSSRTSSRMSGADTRRAHSKPTATKTAQVIRLLSRKPGVSIKQLQEVTGWQAHSIRGLLSGAVRKRYGLEVSSSVGRDGTRRYRIEAGSK